MITGAHFLFYSTNAEADRAFFRDVLQLRSVDAGHGWLIFGMPPTEAAVHPAGAPFLLDQDGEQLLGAVLYLMCDDITSTLETLTSRGVSVSATGNAPWGRFATIRLPSAASIGLYQPTHPTAI
jgi:predicted enzyme related to lactoylglutathione lyase